MFSRREILKIAGMSGLSCLGITRIIAEENNKLDNGIDKIYQIINSKEKLHNICKEQQKKKAWEFTSIPMYYKPSIEKMINQSWYNLLAAGSGKKEKYPRIAANSFLDRATDVFIDGHQYEYFRFTRPESDYNFKLHAVDIKKYYNFYTDSLGCKFGKYATDLFLACDLRDKNNAILANFDNYCGICIFDNSKFIVGQI